MKKSLFNFDKKDDKTTGALDEEQTPVMTSEEGETMRTGKKTKTVSDEGIDPSESKKSE